MDKKDSEQLTVAVVGLGLIGGSLCRALKQRTDHIVLGLDISRETVALALEARAIDREISKGELGLADLTVICLYPEQTVAFIREHAADFKPGSIVADSCGVKRSIVEPAEAALTPHGVRFVGAHPMAGREFSGFAHSTPTLFDRASLVLTEGAETDHAAAQLLCGLARAIGFQEIVTTTPERHDQIIAFTSQLAHVVSNAYMKSPTAQYERGFTGGSFQDLTRVAMLNDRMWTELFSLNREPLLYEIDTMIGHLSQYRDALEKGDSPRLRKLLFEGSELKKQDLKNQKA